MQIYLNQEKKKNRVVTFMEQNFRKGRFYKFEFCKGANFGNFIS